MCYSNVNAQEVTPMKLRIFGAVVLMHDWRYDTLGALERIVTALKADNYLFLPLFRESSTMNTAKPRWG